ncbi:MAG: sterol desaturase family protein [Pseudomonadota bacterium]
MAAALCALFGLLSLMGVLAFRFPALLTTPHLRATYDPDHLRILMAAGLIVCAGCGAFALYKRASLALAFLGLAAAAACLALGGPAVAIGELKPTPFYIGLDWFVIGLLTTGGAFVLIEKLAPLRREQPVLREDWTLDLKHFFMFHRLIGFYLFAGNYIVHEWFSWMIIPGVGGAVRELPFLVQFLLILVAVDFAQYWVHRLYHSPGFFWRVHSVHHSAEHMDWLASSRLNVIEPLITRTLGLLAIAVCGFDQGPINAYILFIGFHATFIHANCGIEFAALERFFVTPKHHHWHHAKDEEAINKNFAVHLSIFDRIFGTYYLPKAWPEAYGVVGEAPPKSLARQQLHPFA